MQKWTDLGKKIKDFVNPDTFPVAVKILEDESQIPSKARRPLRDLKVVMAPCQGSAMAKRYGWTVALSVMRQQPERFSRHFGVLIWGTNWP